MRLRLFSVLLVALAVSMSCANTKNTGEPCRLNGCDNGKHQLEYHMAIDHVYNSQNDIWEWKEIQHVDKVESRFLNFFNTDPYRAYLRIRYMPAKQYWCNKKFNIGKDHWVNWENVIVQDTTLIVTNPCEEAK